MRTIEVKFFRRELKLKLEISTFITEETRIQVKNINLNNKNILIEITHTNTNSHLDFTESEDIKALYLNNHNVIIGESSFLNDSGEFKVFTESKRILLIPIKEYIKLETKNKEDLLNEYKKTLEVVKGIEERGIRSWATSVGYAITVGKLNRIGYELGFERWIDIRERNKK